MTAPALQSDTLNVSAINDLAGRTAPLYCQYSSQNQPQGAYLELEEDGTLRADYDANIGNAVPFEVYHGRTLRYHLPHPDFSGNEIIAIVEDLLPLLERVHAGHSIEWDGSNMTGRLTDDAREADEEIDRLLCTETTRWEPARPVVNDPVGWLYDARDEILTAHRAGRSVEEIAAEYTDDPGADLILLPRDAEAAVREIIATYGDDDQNA